MFSTCARDIQRDLAYSVLFCMKLMFLHVSGTFKEILMVATDTTKKDVAQELQADHHEDGEPGAGAHRPCQGLHAALLQTNWA